MFVVLGMIVLAALATIGLALVKAGRDLDRRADDPGLLAGLVDGSLQRTRTAVDTLIQPDAAPGDVRPTGHAMGERATTYGVFGVGLLGIAAFVVVGILLLGG